MKIVTLCAAAVIAGVVRYPSEGDLIVRDEEAARLKENGFLEGDASDPDGGDGLDGMSVADLTTLAKNEEVDLGTAKKKAEIIAAIRAHRAPTPEAE